MTTSIHPQRAGASKAPPQTTENELGLVPKRVLRHLYTTIQRCQLAAPYLPNAALTTASVEITAATCAREHDHMLGMGAASRLARGESLTEVLRGSPTAPTDGVPRIAFDRAKPLSLDQYAAMLALLAKLRGEHSFFFALLGKQQLSEGFRRVLQACGQARLPVLFYLATELHLEGRKSNRQSEALRTIYTEFGVPVITTDVQDPVGLYRVTTEAMHNARFGRGPTVIETARVITASRKAALRSPEDPLVFLREYMAARQIWDEDWANQASLEAVEELATALSRR
jgi:hypothetical protein